MADAATSRVHCMGSMRHIEALSSSMPKWLPTHLPSPWFREPVART
jgi:hypothetical protein